MLIIFVMFLSQLQNQVYEINRGEAHLCRLFTDIDSFVSARFYTVDDSIKVVLFYTTKGDTFDSVINISTAVFKGLKFYQKNFHRIVLDGNFREEFIKNYEIGWPIISPKMFQYKKNDALLRSIFHSFCCITGTGATGAYIGALWGRTIRKETGYLPCGWQEYSCVIPYEYYSYTIDHTKYYTGVVIGVACGVIPSRELYFKRMKKNILSNLLLHDIIAFDDNGNPITLKEVEKENKGLYTAGFGTLGIIAGGAGILAGIFGLSAPWFDLVPKTKWDEKAVSIPILLISGISFYHFTKFAFEKGAELDRIATFERIKNKRREKQESSD
ncbi:MAG: hypothetical protein ACPL28_06195 [bacterium]